MESGYCSRFSLISIMSRGAGRAGRHLVGGSPRDSDGGVVHRLRRPLHTEGPATSSRRKHLVAESSRKQTPGDDDRSRAVIAVEQFERLLQAAPELLNEAYGTAIAGGRPFL